MLASISEIDLKKEKEKISDRLQVQSKGMDSNCCFEGFEWTQILASPQTFKAFSKDVDIVFMSDLFYDEAGSLKKEGGFY